MFRFSFHGRASNIAFLAAGILSILCSHVYWLEFETPESSYGPRIFFILFPSCCPCTTFSSPLLQFFQKMANRQAAVHQQHGLEEMLLKQATADLWALGGTGHTEVGPYHSNGRKQTRRKDTRPSKGDQTSSLGPRLAWLACEELTSFFQQNDGAGALGARQDGSLFSSSLLSTSNHRANTNPSRPRPWSVGAEKVVRHGISRSGINLILPGRTHRGTTLTPTSPCAYCGLSLACAGYPSRERAELGLGIAGNDDASSPGESVEVVIAGCGRGYHVRCMEETVVSLAPRDGTSSSWRSLDIPRMCN